LKTVPLNGGFEAIVPLGRNLLLAVTEKRKDFAGNLYGWLLYNDIYAPIKYATADGFAPVSFARLPDGDVLVLERRYSMFSGIAVRLCVIARADIRAGQTIPCARIAELKPPMSVDNFEGMAIREAETGEVFIYLISDDNFNRDPLTGQRTLLLMFELMEAPDGAP
jgi:hypothetical protein